MGFDQKYLEQTLEIHDFPRVFHRFSSWTLAFSREFPYKRLVPICPISSGKPAGQPPDNHTKQPKKYKNRVQQNAKKYKKRVQKTQKIQKPGLIKNPKNHQNEKIQKKIRGRIHENLLQADTRCKPPGSISFTQ